LAVEIRWVAKRLGGLGDQVGSKKCRADDVRSNDEIGVRQGGSGRLTGTAAHCATLAQVLFKVAYHDSSAGSEHAGHLADRGGSVDDMAQHGRAQHRGKETFWEWQLVGRSDNEVRSLEPSAQLLHPPDHAWARVDTDSRVDRAGCAPNRRSGAAPNIEQEVVFARLEQFKGLLLVDPEDARQLVRFILTRPPAEPAWRERRRPGLMIHRAPPAVSRCRRTSRCWFDARTAPVADSWIDLSRTWSTRRAVGYPF
jgi:hypothetical protein